MGKIEEKYKSLSDIEHVLLRPGMYIGSVVTEDADKWILTGKKFEMKTVKYNAGFLKLFDEIISNSVDESKRKGTKLNAIKVEVNKESGYIQVWDNGGIPVEIHAKEKVYIPTLCFSVLRAGSNFNDEESRTGVGTNGLGSVATNIFAKEFKVETADGKNRFTQTYTNNLSKKSKPEISSSGSHYTRITYIPDFERFGMTGIDDDSFKLIESRVYEVAGTNPSLKICFNGKNISTGSFENYCMMFIPDNSDFLFEETKDKYWSVGVAPSNNGFQNVSFVNGVSTFVGGSHIEYILNQILPEIREKISKKYKTDILPGQIKNQMMLFVNATVCNPKFSSQTKERMISEKDSFLNPITLSDKFITNLCKSEIVNLISDWLDQKKEADEKKAEREANKNLSKVRIEKLIDATGKDRKKCIFFIAEGDSPLSSFRKFRNPQVHGAIPIRGKIKNVYGLSGSQALQNEEVKSIFASLGLKIGQHDHSDMRYGEIALMTDMDRDGDCICGLLLNIFYKFFPELVEQKRIFRIVTPLLTVVKGKEEIEFYTMDEYDSWCKKNDSTKWEVRYAKGLAALSDKASDKMINDPKKFYFTKDDLADEKFNIWFGDDTDLRKKELI